MNPLNNVVLLVDDQLPTLRDVIGHLADTGFDVKQCGSADLALKSFQKFADEAYAEVDVIVLDVGLPPPKRGLPPGYQQTGGYLLESLRSWDRGTRPVVLFSQLSEDEVIEPAWHSYDLWCKRLGQPIARANSAIQYKRALKRQFKVWVELKQKSGPVKLARLLKRILSQEGVHNPLCD